MYPSISVNHRWISASSRVWSSSSQGSVSPYSPTRRSTSSHSSLLLSTMTVVEACQGHGHERYANDTESKCWRSNCSPTDQITYATFGSPNELPDARLAAVHANTNDAAKANAGDDVADNTGEAVLELVNKAIRILRLWIRRLFPPFCRYGRAATDAKEPESEDITDDPIAKALRDRTSKWTCEVHRDDDTHSATTEATDLLSESGSFNENPADASDVDDEEDIARSKAARLLRVASSCPQERLLCVDKYLCKCGKCAQYKIIEEDVANVITWRDPEELRSVARLLQAFSTYNEEIGYRPDMIGPADDCLSVWCGDEDQAFTSFVVLQDVVPFLCANTA